MKEILFDLCKTSGVSGSENNIVSLTQKYFEKFCDVSTDINGNLFAKIEGNRCNKNILLDAHIDQIGLMVTLIEDNGFLRVAKCGGMDMRVLQGSAVIVHGKEDILGIVACMPPHLSDNKEDTAILIENVLIDTGLSSDEVRKNVSLGDTITFYCEPKSLLNSRVSAAALDNRAGVAVLIKCAQILCENKEKQKYNVTFLLSTQEETYARGAKTGAFGEEYDESIVVDVSFANQLNIGSCDTVGELDGGPMICLSPVLDKEMNNSLISLAKSTKISYQIEVCSSRTGTNADHISTTKCGIKTALVSVPQRYMHTQAEVVSINDIESCASLIANYVMQGGEE